MKHFQAILKLKKKSDDSLVLYSIRESKFITRFFDTIRIPLT